jgi:Xaa-Pro dipeptidase
MDDRLLRTIEALRECDADWAVLSGADSIAYAFGYAPPIETGASPFAAGPSLAVIGRDGAAGMLALEGTSALPREGIVVSYDGYGRTQSLAADAAYAKGLSHLLPTLGVGVASPSSPRLIPPPSTGGSPPRSRKSGPG